jgi:hypothetical protein
MKRIQKSVVGRQLQCVHYPDSCQLISINCYLAPCEIMDRASLNFKLWNLTLDLLHIGC